MEIRVLLFVQDGEAKQKYLDTLTDCGVRVFVSTSFFHLSEEICSQTYHGLFFDLSTKMKAIKENKVEVYRLAEKFPVAHLQMDRGSGAIRCFHVGRQTGRSLHDFIDSQCRPFEPQKLRTSMRREMHLPVLLFRHPASKCPERSITKDISPGGCFVITTRRFTQGIEIFLGFPELTDSTPIRAQIRTVVKWGMRYQIPGIGVKFEALSMTQAAELERMCRPAAGR